MWGELWPNTMIQKEDPMGMKRLGYQSKSCPELG